MQQAQDERFNFCWSDYEACTDLLCEGFVRHYVRRIRTTDLSIIVSSYLCLVNTEVESIAVWRFLCGKIFALVLHFSIYMHLQQNHLNLGTQIMEQCLKIEKLMIKLEVCCKHTQ